MLARLGVRLEDSSNGSFMVHNNSESSLVIVVKSKQNLGKSSMEFKESVLGKLNKTFSRGDGILRCQGRLCVPNVDGLRDRFLKEAHGSRYSIHPVCQKYTMTLGKCFGGKD